MRQCRKTRAYRSTAKAHTLKKYIVNTVPGTRYQVPSGTDTMYLVPVLGTRYQVSPPTPTHPTPDPEPDPRPRAAVSVPGVAVSERAQSWSIVTERAQSQACCLS